MKIIVIIPTYNERVNIERLLPLLEEKVFPQIKNHEMGILIADDQSPDKTAEIVEKDMKKWKNITLLEGNKEGLGAAYVRAMHYAMEKLNAEAVIEFDADFQHDPDDIPRLIQAMDDGADYVIGSRYIPGGKIPPEWGLHRKMMSFFGSLFARIVLYHPNVHDLTSGYKLTKSEYLKKIDLDHLYSQYYAYKIHILHDVLKSGAKVKEVPIIFYERKEGSSKIAKKDLFDSFWVVIRLRLRDSLRIIKFLVVGGTGFIMQLLIQEMSIRLGVAAFIAVGISALISLFITHTDVASLTDGVGAGIGAEAAILSNFFFNNLWTFQDTNRLKENANIFKKLLKFNAASFFSIFIQFFSVWVAVKFIGPRVHLLGYIIPTRILILFPTIILLVIPFNYIVYNRFVWKTHHLKNGHTTKK
jgi:dolichol-phosphate mannosyltransferase